MKISIAISAMILATAAGLGWQIDRRLAAARAGERQLAAEAARFGIPTGDAHTTRSAKRIRIDRDAEARLLAVEYIQLVQASAKGEKPDEILQTRYRDISVRIAALDAASLMILIADVLASRELDEKKRAEQAVLLLRGYARKDPHAALAFVMEHSATLKGAKDIEYVISDSLGNWAKDDPISAVEWMKKNALEFPDAMKAQSIHNVIYRTAAKDPKLAFTLIAGLGLNYSDAHSALNRIVTVANTNEARTATLAALREYRDANQADKALIQAVDDNLGYFSQGLRKVSFADASQWVEDAKMNPTELNRFCERLSNGIVEDTGRWIEWMGKAFPPGKGDGCIMDMISSWTRRDYEAAGKWLVSAPEGPVKNAAIRGYAQTIFKHDPETAMQWIMTLPPGSDRDNTLRNIHSNWPKDDREGAASFAKEHDIK